jgi:hypothetical protein
MEIPRKKRQLIRWVLFGVGFAILAYFIAQSGLPEYYQTLLTVHIPLYLLALGCTLTVIFFRIVRWRYLCTAYGTPVSWKEATIVSVSSLYYANITPGKIGDVSKAYFMQQRHGMSLADGASMIFYERFFELVILFFTACAIVFIELKGITVILLEVIAVLLTLLFIFYLKIDLLISLIEWIAARVPAIRRISTGIRIRKLPFPKIAGVLAITACSLGFDFLQLFVVALAFGYLLNPVLLSISLSVSILAGLVSQIPLGVGVTEASLGYFLETMGVPSGDSIAIVLSSRLISMYFVLVLGFIASRFAESRALEGPP